MHRACSRRNSLHASRRLPNNADSVLAIIEHGAHLGNFLGSQGPIGPSIICLALTKEPANHPSANAEGKEPNRYLALARILLVRIIRSITEIALCRDG